MIFDWREHQQSVPMGVALPFFGISCTTRSGQGFHASDNKDGRGKKEEDLSGGAYVRHAFEL